jgi:hypothetical protein
VTYLALRLCSGRAAYEAVPNPRRSLDLARIRGRLERDGVAVVDARVMLIAQLEREVTIARDGRILVKTADFGEARRLFERLQPLLEG